MNFIPNFWAVQPVEHQIIGVDRVVHQHAAEGVVPVSPPVVLVILRIAEPVNLACRDIGLAGNAGGDQMLGLLRAVIIAILHDRHDMAAGARFGIEQFIDIGKRADQRLFADHVLAGLERGKHQCLVGAGRRADVNHVDIVHA